MLNYRRNRKVEQKRQGPFYTAVWQNKKKWEKKDEKLTAQNNWGGMKAQPNECLHLFSNKDEAVWVYFWLLLKSIPSIGEGKNPKKPRCAAINTDVTRRILIRWTLCATAVVRRFLTVCRKDEEVSRWTCRPWGTTRVFFGWIYLLKVIFPVQAKFTELFLIRLEYMKGSLS